MTAVSYFNWAKSRAEVAVQEDGDAWQVEIVDDDPQAGEYSSVWVDGSVRPMMTHQAYEPVTYKKVLRAAVRYLSRP